MGYTVTKPFRYGGKMLEAGDPFEPVRARDIKIMKALKKISDGGDEINELREQAISLGIEIDGRWGASRLREKIAEANGSRPPEPFADNQYQRRDLRAED